MTIQLIALVPTDGAARTFTLGFDNPGPVCRFLDELVRQVPTPSVLALAVDGQPVAWRRGVDGVVIEGPLGYEAQRDRGPG